MTGVTYIFTNRPKEPALLRGYPRRRLRQTKPITRSYGLKMGFAVKNKANLRPGRCERRAPSPQPPDTNATQELPTPPRQTNPISGAQ